MATGNFILKGASKKIGNIVTYSRNGKQITRMLQTSIKNPKTVRQAEQRMFLAPAPKFYSPLSVVLEESWENKNKSDSYTAFLKQAVDDARANGWFIPKGEGFRPLPYIVSKGSLPMISLSVLPDDTRGKNFLVFKGISTLDITADTVGHVSQLLINAGYAKEGDQLTIILFDNHTESNTYVPHYGRIILDSLSVLPITDAFPLFQFYGNEELGSDEPMSVTFNSNVFDSDHVMVGGVAIISRFESRKWRRSTQRVILAAEELQKVNTKDAYEIAVMSYMDIASTTVQSDIYLNGSTGTEGGGSVQVIALNDGRPITLTSMVAARDMLTVQGTVGSMIQTNVGILNGMGGANNGKYLKQTTEGSSATYSWVELTTPPASYVVLDSSVSGQLVKDFLVSKGVPATSLV